MVFFNYAYRSLLARLRASAITMLAITLFVGGGSLGLGYYLNLDKQIVTAPPENIIVVSKGAAAEEESRLVLDAARKVILLDGIKKDGTEPLAVRELVGRVFATSTRRFEEPSLIRGIDERAFAVHHAKLVAGTLPAPGSLEILVGQRLAAVSPQLTIGYDMHLPGGTSRITGVFSAGGGPLEDELWTPRAALELHLKRTSSNSVTLVATSADVVPQIVDRINNSKDIDAHASSLVKFNTDHTGLKTIARTVLVLLILLSMVATFAIATTMNANVLARLPEFAALAAIGIRKGVLARIVLVESLLLALAGAGVGALASSLITSQIGRIKFGPNPVEMSFSPTALGVALGLGVVVGVLGGLAPAIQVRRLDILAALR